MGMANKIEVGKNLVGLLEEGVVYTVWRVGKVVYVADERKMELTTRLERKE